MSQDIVDSWTVFARGMSIHKPSAKVRMAVAAWPDDAPRGAVAAFCREHQVSRSWFYKVRAASTELGRWQAMELASTRPRRSPSSTSQEMIETVLAVRVELEKGGWDNGPLSVQSALLRRGVESPSRATLARIFTRAGVVIAEPKKKPRSAFRRFVHPAPNCLWQIDATEWTLVNGRVVVIFQLLDDHSRLALASLVASSENSIDAIRVVKLALARHGIPRKFLSDNGSAFNPSRRGWVGQLVLLLRAHGVTPITGKPGKPTTQGKNERVHKTLHKYLNAQPPAETIDELQDLVDVFDEYYNTQREHQSLPSGMTPKEAWDATPVAAAPDLPDPDGDYHHIDRAIEPRGEVQVFGTRFMIGKIHGNSHCHIIYNATEITFFDTAGTELISYLIPPAGTRYVGKRSARQTEVSTMS